MRKVSIRLRVALSFTTLDIAALIALLRLIVDSDGASANVIYRIMLNSNSVGITLL